MFTGIIEETGTVECLERRSGGACLDLRGQKVLSDLKVGDSISVNGVCLTATAVSTEGFRTDLSPETLTRSTLGRLRAGDLVNLERPLTPTERLGGHFVQGHVDAVGTLASLDSLADGNWWLTVDVPEELLHHLVFKGSVAIDGISLTVASLEGNLLGVAIIPYTYKRTNLVQMSPGAKVNLECDVIAKYVERLLGAVDRFPKSTLCIDDLRGQGY